MIYLKFADKKKSAEEWGIVSLKVERLNGAADSAKITFADEETAASIPTDCNLEIFDADLRKFCGQVVETPKALSGGSRRAQIVAKNAWAHLEGIVYQQLWESSETESGEVFFQPVQRSKVVLGQNSSGEKIDAAAQAQNILQYAISCGAPLSIGTIDANSQMLLDQRSDISCAEALKRTLRWLPNSQIYFDYSADGLPKINIVQRKNLPQAVLLENGTDTLSLSVKSRPDLRLNGVVIKYERENSSGENVWRTIEEESYPEDLGTPTKNTLVMTVELAGSRERVKVYELVCETIQPESKQWWRSHIPSLPEDFEILETSRSHPELTRELVKGQLASHINARSQSDVITARISLADESGKSAQQTLNLTLRATNAVSGSYPEFTPTLLREPKPEGMAKSIYEAACDLQYQGDATVLGLCAEKFAGKKVALTLADGASLSAPAVAIVEDFAKETTNVKFGPPTHLYADDIVELFRINRDRLIPETFSTSNIEKEEVPLDVPILDTTQNLPDYERLIISDHDETAPRTIDINAEDLDEGSGAKMRRVAVVKNGQLAYAKILMTDPEIEEESGQEA